MLAEFVIVAPSMRVAPSCMQNAYSRLQSSPVKIEIRARHRPRTFHPHIIRARQKKGLKNPHQTVSSHPIHQEWKNFAKDTLNSSRRK